MNLLQSEGLPVNAALSLEFPVPGRTGSTDITGRTSPILAPRCSEVSIGCRVAQIRAPWVFAERRCRGVRLILESQYAARLLSAIRTRRKRYCGIFVFRNGGAYEMRSSPAQSRLRRSALCRIWPGRSLMGRKSARIARLRKRCRHPRRPKIDTGIGHFGQSCLLRRIASLRIRLNHMQLTQPPAKVRVRASPRVIAAGKLRAVRLWMGAR
jgi:hypothetical protein